MKDENAKFNKFYRDYVVLPNEKTQELRDKKNINIERLKSGLSDYNDEKSTSYKLIDNVTQGSVAMATTTQNDNNESDYDIDVAIIFKKDNIPDGTTAVKNIIVDTLKRKCSSFNSEPEFKTNCVRLTYAEGYHIDFAIYRRQEDENSEFKYEHCGSSWTPRDPRTITQWFTKENKEQGYKIRKIVRLLKMFCKSRSNWNMPGGLILSVLVVECFKKYERLDESFYYTINSIKDRLNKNSEICNPVDDSISLINTEEHKTQVTNLLTRLSTYIDKLQILFDVNCTDNQAIQAWNDFFNHSFWEKALTENVQLAKAEYNSTALTSLSYDETEENIEDYFPTIPSYFLSIDCIFSNNGQTVSLKNELKQGHRLKIGKSLKFYIANTNVPEPFDVYWKVLNRGPVAKQRNCLRGNIERDKYNNKFRYETSDFCGHHYVDCYIVKNNICVARDRIDVPIIP